MGIEDEKGAGREEERFKWFQVMIIEILQSTIGGEELLLAKILIFSTSLWIVRVCMNECA